MDFEVGLHYSQFLKVLCYCATCHLESSEEPIDVFVKARWWVNIESVDTEILTCRVTRLYVSMSAQPAHQIMPKACLQCTS